ncbi:MAG: 6-phosphofructokinase [Clostridiales bacterium]|nr:6-phosphofructokinase [Clostridiales bacterium]
MENAVKRIGVLTSGGDSPGMNAAVRAVVRTALSRGIDVIGIRRGWSGLITGDVFRMDGDSVAHIINRGGTILYTARCEEFKTEEGQQKAVATCKLLGIDGVVAIGGDGTFRGCLALSRHGISVVGIPGTIDNDIGCTHYSIGYDTAANTAIEAIDRLRDTMQSHERCSVVEVMGHRAGNLALYVGIATGATAVLMPEHPWDFQKDVAERIRNARLHGKSHFMIIVAEGAFNNDEIMKNPGSAAKVAEMIHEELGIEPRVTVLGHIQRGGCPNARDRVTATRMGYWAVECLAAGKNNRVVCHQGGTVCDMDMEEALEVPHSISASEERVLQAMTGFEG